MTKGIRLKHSYEERKPDFKDAVRSATSRCQERNDLGAMDSESVVCFSINKRGDVFLYRPFDSPEDDHMFLYAPQVEHLLRFLRVRRAKK